MGKGADSLGWLDNDGLKLANARRRACRSCRSAHERGKRETLATRAWGFKGRGSKRDGQARLLDAVPAHTHGVRVSVVKRGAVFGVGGGGS